MVTTTQKKRETKSSINTFKKRIHNHYGNIILDEFNLTPDDRRIFQFVKDTLHPGTLLLSRSGRGAQIWPRHTSIQFNYAIIVSVDIANIVKKTRQDYSYILNVTLVSNGIPINTTLCLMLELNQSTILLYGLDLDFPARGYIKELMIVES